MSYMMSDITDQYLTKIYDDLQREQNSLMNSFKNGGLEDSREREITKQITLINSVMVNVLKLRSFRKKIRNDS